MVKQSVPAVAGVLANDSDLDGDPLTATLVSGPAEAASFVLNKDGTFDYTPNPDYYGIDTFTYEVSDGNGGTAQGTATITVNSVNDAPTVSATATNPTFTEGGAAADLYNAVSIGTVENGESIDQIVLTISNVTDGVDEILKIDGTVVPLTNANSGTTTSNSYGFTVAVAGNTASVTLTTTGSTPTAAETLLDTLSYQNNASPPTVANRVVTLLSVQDSGGTANGGNDAVNPGIASTVTIDRVPTAVNDTNTATEAGVDATGNVITNDTPGDAPATVAAADEAGTPITLGAAFATVNGGSLTLNSNGSYTYTPPAQGSVPPGGLTEVFNYTLTDADGDTSSATLTINVTEQNDAPTNVVPGTQNTFQDTTLVFSAANGNAITVGDADAGANPIEVTLLASNGTVSLASTTGLTFVVGDGTADGSMTFTATVANINTALNGLRFDPNAGFQGTATLRIITDDLGNSGAGGALSDLDIVNVMVEAAPAPVAPSGPLPPLDEILLTMANEPASNGLTDSRVLGLSAVEPPSATAPSADESPQEGGAILRGGARDTNSDDLFPAEKPFSSSRCLGIFSSSIPGRWGMMGTTTVRRR